MFKKDKLFLFAGDQKIEHLNKDFYGKNINPESADPEHLFKIADSCNKQIDLFATQLGLIYKYGQDYKNINYLVKLNSKTDLVPTEQKDPVSLALNTIEHVVEFSKTSQLSILGVGYTIYLGSEYESKMLSEASDIIYKAHKNNLLVVLWIYPRGKAVKDEFSPEIISGAAGVACCLGADFVKLNPPAGKNSLESATFLKQAVIAAGRTKVICSGGKFKEEKDFLEQISNQINIAGTAGVAIGRNLHQRSLSEAEKLSEKIANIIK